MIDKIQVPAIELDLNIEDPEVGGTEHFLTSESTIERVTVHFFGRTVVMTAQEFFIILDKGIQRELL